MSTKARDIANQQLEAYNNHDLDTFCALFHPDARLYDLVHDRLVLEGIDDIRAMYAERFSNPELHCTVHTRMELANFAIDRETVSGMPDEPMEIIAIYEIDHNLIKSVRFIRA